MKKLAFLIAAIMTLSGAPAMAQNALSAGVNNPLVNASKTGVGLTNNGGTTQTGSLVINGIGQPAAPSIISGFTAGTTNYYWCEPEDINLAAGPISTGIGTAGTTGTMQCGGSTGAITYMLLRTASSTAPSGTGDYLVGTCTTVSGSTCNIPDANNALTSTTVCGSASGDMCGSTVVVGSSNNYPGSVAALRFNNGPGLNYGPLNTGPIDLFFPYGGSTGDYYTYMVGNSSGGTYAAMDDAGAANFSLLQVNGQTPTYTHNNHIFIYGDSSGAGGTTRPTLVLEGDSDGKTQHPFELADTTGGLGTIMDVDQNGNIFFPTAGNGEAVYFGPLVAGTWFFQSGSGNMLINRSGTGALATWTPTDFGFSNPVTAPQLVPTKQASAPAAPGAGSCTIFAVAGTNTGTCKIESECGTSTTPVVIVDNVGGGC